MLNWQPLYPGFVYLVAAIGIIAVLLLAYRVAVTPGNRRWLLFALRAMVFSGLLVLLLNPIDRREDPLPPKPPSVAMLVDCSQSMSLGQQESRLDRVRRTIESSSRSIKSERPYDLDLYRFGSRLTKVPSVAALNASDDASLLDQALDRLPARLTEDPPRAVILFSDGAVRESEALGNVAAAFRDRGIPIYAMLPDHDQLQGDIAVTKLTVPQRVASGDQATIQAVIEHHGFDQERLLVTVRPANRPLSRPLASLPITLTQPSTSCELVVTADPSLGDLVLEVPLFNGEAVDTNNRVMFQLGERSRQLKVLYMEGTAGREYRWIEEALQEDPDIECVSMVVNNQYAARPTLQRINDSYRGFPSTREELFEYDVVICSDISRAAFTPEQINWTTELVAQRGGGFVMIGGHTSFGSGGWDRTPWEKLIAFDMTGRRDYLNQSFSIEVPTDAESHPIWKLVDDPNQNRAALQSMPSFRGTNLISRVKPAATLLGQTDGPLLRVGVMPVFACETYGRGRTFAMATDSTADWGRYFESNWGEGDNRYFRKFWRNVIRWLAENSRASQYRLIVRTDQVIYGRDEPIQVMAEAYDEGMQVTTNYRVTASLVAADAANVDLSQPGNVNLEVHSGWQQYVGSLPCTPAASPDQTIHPMQSVQLIVQAWDGDEEVARETVHLQLLNQSEEWLRPQTRPETLREVADVGGGRMLDNQQDLDQLLRSFESSPGEVLVHRLPLWDHSLIWATLVGALAIEWTLRRRGTTEPAAIK